MYRENNRHKKLDEESSYFGCAPLYEETTSRQWSVGKWSFFSRDMDIVLLVVGSMDEAGNTYPFPDPYIAQFDIRNSSEENLELSKGARRYYLASK